MAMRMHEKRFTITTKELNPGTWMGSTFFVSPAGTVCPLFFDIEVLP
jgi:hypothetical protein